MKTLLVFLVLAFVSICAAQENLPHIDVPKPQDENIVVSSANKPRDPVLTAFYQWAKDQKMDLSNIRIIPDATSGYKVVAKKLLIDGDDIITIPENAIFDSEQPNSEINNFLQNITDPMTRLHLYLLHERFVVKNSKWKPWIDILPKFVDIPMFWATEQLQMLAGSWVLDRISEEFVSFTSTHKQLVGPLVELYPETFPSEFFNYERFLWASSIIKSRSFVIEKNEKKRIMLVPLADMLSQQMTVGHPKTVYTSKNSQLTITSKATFLFGSEITMDNGMHRGNQHLLSSFGVLVPNNPYDKVALPLSWRNADPNIENYKLKYLQLRRMKALDYPVHDNEYFISQAGVSDLTKVFLRLKHYNPTLENLEKGAIFPDFHHKISEENEQAITADLQEIGISLLKKYPTTLEQDKKLLENLKPEQTREKLAIMLRMREKEILMKFLNINDWNILDQK